jgi:hypothetical protein
MRAADWRASIQATCALLRGLSQGALLKSERPLTYCAGPRGLFVEELKISEDPDLLLVAHDARTTGSRA